MGYLPVGPGTVASALPAFFAFLSFYHKTPRLFILSILLLLALLFGWATFAFGSQIEESAEKKDPQRVVSDEIAGQSLALLTSIDALSCLVSFLLFRLLDVLKPWPIRRLEELKGGLGILADDVAAGIVTALVLLVLNLVKA